MDFNLDDILTLYCTTKNDDSCELNTTRAAKSLYASGKRPKTQCFKHGHLLSLPFDILLYIMDYVLESSNRLHTSPKDFLQFCMTTRRLYYPRGNLHLNIVRPVFNRYIVKHFNKLVELRKIMKRRHLMHEEEFFSLEPDYPMNLKWLMFDKVYHRFARLNVKKNTHHQLMILLVGKVEQLANHMKMWKSICRQHQLTSNTYFKNWTYVQ